MSSKKSALSAILSLLIGLSATHTMVSADWLNSALTIAKNKQFQSLMAGCATGALVLTIGSIIYKKAKKSPAFRKKLIVGSGIIATSAATAGIAYIGRPRQIDIDNIQDQFLYSLGQILIPVPAILATSAIAGLGAYWVGFFGENTTNPGFETYAPSIENCKGFAAMAGGIPESIIDVSNMLANPDKYQRAGIDLPKGIILYGRPGTGKTSIVRALVQQCKLRGDDVVAFIVQGPKLRGMYVGHTGPRIDALFAEVRKVVAQGKKAIVFIDEIDAAAPQRYSGPQSDIASDLTTPLLTHIDGIANLDNTIVIGATNRIEDVDDGIKRPERLGRHIEIDLPSLDAKKQIFAHYLSQRPFKRAAFTNKEINYIFGTLLPNTISPAGIKELIKEAAIIAFREKDTEDNGRTYITFNDIVQAHREQQSNKKNDESYRSMYS